MNYQKIDEMIRIVFYIIIFMFGAIVGALSLNLLFSYKINQILKSERSKYLDFLRSEKISFFKHLELIKILKKRKDEYKKESSERFSEIRSLRQHIEEISNEHDMLLQEDKNEVNGNSAEILTELNLQQVKECKYYSIPETDGKFFKSKGSEAYDDNKFYKIEWVQNSNEGFLYFISGLKVLKAIEKPEAFLNPVCEITNYAEISNYSRIQMELPGKVISNNDYWVIDPSNKVKIKIL